MTSDDRAAIEQTIRTYFDGLYEGDVSKLASVFHESSSLTWEHDGKLDVLGRDAWFDVVSKRASPRSAKMERDDAILQIDQSGPTTAFVKVKCQIPPRYFTDYLNLLKIDGKWMIAQKVYATRTTATPNAAS